MQNSGIGIRYARALLELGEEEKSTAKWLEELQGFVSIYEQSRDLRTALRNPSIKIEERKGLVRVLAQKTGLSPMIGNFLLLLLDKDRTSALPQIFEAFRALADQKAGNVRAQVSSAQKLDTQQVARIKASLAKMTGKNVIIEQEVDESLIGGVVTRLDGKVYDGSLRTQLESLRSRAAGSL